MLRSLRLGEADRILHLYTRERGRIGAVAKGIRKTKSRFGARLEPLSHVALQLHQGSGELQTVTGVDLVRSHSAVREEPYRLSVGLIGAEAMLRLFTEQERNERAFVALTRFLDVLDETGARSSTRRSRPARALVPAQAALALGLPAAPDELRRVRRGRCAARRLLAAGRRCRLPCLRERLAVALAGGARRHRGAAPGAARRGVGRGSQRTRGPRRARRRHGVVRVPRRLSAAHAQRLDLQGEAAVRAEDAWMASPAVDVLHHELLRLASKSRRRISFRRRRRRRYDAVVEAARRS